MTLTQAAMDGDDETWILRALAQRISCGRRLVSKELYVMLRHADVEIA